MAPRQTFGKRTKARSDAFASMLHSSPDIKIAEDKPVLASKKQTVEANITELRRSPRRKKTVALEEKHHNAVSRPNDSGQQLMLTKKEAIGDEENQLAMTTSHTHSPENFRVTHARRTSNETIGSGREVAQRSRAKTSLKTKTKTKTQLPTELSLCVDGEKTRSIWPDCPYHKHCTSLLNLQEGEIQSFEDWSQQLAEHLDLTKIAEASYGEVYRLAVKDSVDSSDLSLTKCGQSVLKIIALKPPTELLPRSKREREQKLRKTDFMSTPQDVATEVRLLQRMSSIPGFINFRDVRILQGRPGALFAKAYKDYNKSQKKAGKEKSIFPDPANKYSYAHDQLWAVIEMQDAGTDVERLLERMECQSVFYIWDIFWQVVLSLAKGEESAEFEHRDLHLGNICVRGDTQSKTHGIHMSKKLGYTDIDVTLIDYTISRASMPSSIDDDESVAYLDLSQDQHIFNGDSTNEYQYDIYRYMRSALYFDDALAKYNTEDQALVERTERSWKQFQPQTNLIWLHFVLHTLFKQLTVDNNIDKSSREMTKLTLERSEQLNSILNQVHSLLEPDVVIKNGLRSAGDLVAIAVERKWLDTEDIIGSEQSMLDATLERSFAALSLVR